MSAAEREVSVRKLTREETALYKVYVVVYIYMFSGGITVFLISRVIK